MYSHIIACSPIIILINQHHVGQQIIVYSAVANGSFSAAAGQFCLLPQRTEF